VIVASAIVSANPTPKKTGGGLESQAHFAAQHTAHVAPDVSPAKRISPSPHNTSGTSIWQANAMPYVICFIPA
jgi:hypothetical protein